MREDLRTAIRSLRKSPTFTAVALVVLALGIGAGTAIFSVVDAVVLRGLPFDAYDRLVAVAEHDTKRATTFGDGSITPQTYLDWRAQQRSFDGLAAISSSSFGIRDGAGHFETTRALRVTAEFFPVLHVAPLIGRQFTTDDEVYGRHRVVILSYGLWQRRFGGARDVVGRTLALDDEPWDVVGVMPRGFAYPIASEHPTELYVPVAFRPQDRVRGSNRNYNYTAIGRLKTDVSIAAASDQMNRVAAALEAQFPKWGPGRRVRIVTLHEHLVGKVKSWMVMLLAAVGLVLLIACANVANLMLARATARSSEIAIRSALGAPRAAIVRALLVEALVLSACGAAIGVALAWAGVHAIIPWLPAGLPRVTSIAIDLRVLAAATLASMATGVGFGLLPALQSSRPNLTTALKDTSRSATAGAASHRLRSALVVAEVALAVVLTVGAGLFIGSFASLMRVDPGFDYHDVLAVDVGPRIQNNNLREAVKQGAPYATRMLEAVSRVPGVERAAVVANGLPLEGSWSRANVTIAGQELKGDDDAIDHRVVTPGYLPLMRIPLVRGRSLDDGDREGGQMVAVINEAAARKYWPGQDALGRRFTIDGKARLVVGIVGNIHQFGPETPPRQECYLPIGQQDILGATLVMRTNGNPLRLLPAVKAAIWSVSKDQRISGDIFTLEGYMDRLIAQRRFNMVLLVLFAALALAISAVGIYGVMAYVVAQRTGEIGVRMALGATPGSVVGMVARRAGLLVAAGLAIGSTMSWYLRAVVKSFLFETQPTDPRVFMAALVVLALASMAATAVPARRAATVDPIIALRQE